MTYRQPYCIIVDESSIMNACAYCLEELSRLMFCNHSHQVLFHRKKSRKKPAIIMDKDAPPMKETFAMGKQIDLCKHGSMMGLCKHGCKR